LETIMARTHHVAPAARQDHLVQRSSWTPALGPGMVLGVVSAIGVVVSLFMSWRVGDVHPSGIPLAFLFDNGTTAHDPSILLALIPFAVVLAIGAAMPGASAARVIGGIGVLAVVVLFGIQLNQQVDRIPGANLGDALDTGFYVAAIAGFIGLVSGFLPSGWAQRTETASSVEVGRDVYDEPRI
jgi:hypothetical protein